MEDEDVDSVGNKFSAPIGESNKIDSSLTINSIAKNASSSENNSDSPSAEGNKTADEENSSSVNKLKSVLVNHDAGDIDRFKRDEESSTDLPSPSPKKVNGEVGKSESCASSEESCDYNKNESVNSNEDPKRKSEEEADASDSKDSSKRKRLSSDHSDASNNSENESDDGSSSNSSPVEFRGFKRRKIFEMGTEKLLNVCETNRQVEVVNSDTVIDAEKPKSVELRRSARNASIAKRHNSEAIISVETKEESGDQLTEYAQYLGLQPTVKFKCGRCGEKHFQSMSSLNAHQLICCKTSSNALTKQTKPQSDSNLSTNFRITRKVYLCSACGTYYENWKLFLHMRDMHKRHICLFCLGMFSVAERLAEHLLYQHNVHEKTCKSPEEFLNLFKGSCYLTCCSCEKMFTERDDFYDHQCKDAVASNVSNWNNDSVTLTPKDIKELAQKCSLCGVKCGHFRTCPKVAHKFQQNSQSSSFTNSPSTPNSNTPNLSLEKYYVPVPANVQKNWTPNNLNQEILKQALSHSAKDYYDGSAASFCQVDIANDSDNQSSPEKAALGKSNIERKKCINHDSCKSPSRCHDIEDFAVNKDQGEQQGDYSKLLPNNSNNSIVNSVSEESDNSDDRDNSNIFEEQDEEVKEGSDDEISNKELNDDDDDDNYSDNKMSVEEEDDAYIQGNLEKVGNSKIVRKGIKAMPDEEDETSVVEDKDLGGKSKLENEMSSCSLKLFKVREDAMSDEADETPEVEDKDLRSKSKLDNEISSCSLKLFKVREDAMPDEADVEDRDVGSKSNLENEISSCSVKLFKIGEDTVFDKEEEDEDEELEEEEEISQHDSASNSNSSSVNSRSSSRNSTDNHNDDSQENIVDKDAVVKSGKTEDDKKGNSTESISTNEDHVENTLDESSSNNEEKLSQSSNEEINDRLENSKDDRSDGNESDDSDKLSVVLCEDELVGKTNDEDSNICKRTPTDELEKGENMETDVINEQGEVNGGDGNDSSTLQEGDSENDDAMEESQDTIPPKESCFQYDGVSIQLASEEVMAMALTLEDKMDSLSSQSVVKECVRTSCTTCSYCSHAVKIGVNGKQLAIHLLTEHRYMPVKNETMEDIVERLKKSLDELQDVWFNTDSYDSSDKTCFVPYDHTYECFQCNYSANTHKDLFSHKRKVHQKTILYCSMCKENFYSYSELLCHMCPGLYDAAKDIQFRCCLCSSDRIPSAFRLMVHLRKTHNTCDICLEIVDDQQKLSAHMVKHKLHHLCYRCGIAYRNKPDITKHLFWKHGTESVLCKKCLQKKWPHVYHFCIPPSSFICEECNLSFSKAVYLKVHKRFHNNNLPYSCNSCEQKFVSKKLLVKHERTHEIATVEDSANNEKTYKSSDAEKRIEQNDLTTSEQPASLPEESACTVQSTETPEKSDETSVKPHKKKSKKDKDKKIKPVVDVYDLPPLNLSSESDDTEDEKETRPTKTSIVEDNEPCKPDEVKTSAISNDEMQVDSKPTSVGLETKMAELNPTESAVENEESTQPVTVVDGIWDNFHTYKAEQEKRENLDIANKQSILSQLDPALPPVVPKDTVLGDHDYCLPNNAEEKSGQADETDPSGKAKSNEHSSSIDHDYCTQKNNLDNSNADSAANLLNLSNQSENTETPPKRKQKSPKKKMMKQHNNSSSSSDSSSESDSSSCSCGTNCSCTSSSSNSSSSSSSDSDSSSSDGRNNNSGLSTNKREKKKERLKSKRKGEAVKMTEPPPPAEEPTVIVPVEAEEPLIKESDLETDETATDEEFYDQYPQMQANQILAEKRNQLMLLATVAPTVNNGTASPPVPNNSNSTNINLDPVSSPKLEIVAPPVASVLQPQTQSKKKVKTKKRRKSSTLGMGNRNRSASKQHNLAYETPQPSTSFSSLLWQSSPHGKKVANDVSPMYMQSSIQPMATAPITASIKVSDRMSLSSPVTNQHHQMHHSHEGSESNSSKRFSKRRRVRNKFYGYSSDEEGEHQQTPPTKWKKFSSVDSNVKNVHHQQPQQPYSQPFQQPISSAHPEYNHSYQQQLSPVPTPPKIAQPAIRTTFEENQINNSLVPKRTMPAPLSSGSGSDSEADSDSDTNRLAINQQMSATSITGAGLNAGASEKDDKLYCYCQCPYDEVSEMIACDGLDCAIEWFHFECVGIMVPPKGKWYCPDCRKRRGLS